MYHFSLNSNLGPSFLYFKQNDMFKEEQGNFAGAFEKDCRL